MAWTKRNMTAAAVAVVVSVTAATVSVVAQTGNPAPPVNDRLCVLEALAGVEVYDECVPPTTTSTLPPSSTTVTTTSTTTTAAPTTTAPPTTTTAPPTTTSTVPSSGFFEDFSSADSLDRFFFDIDHRDDVVVEMLEWPGDHQVTGPNDECGPPEDRRIVHRDTTEYVYRCVPGGDPIAAHVMTSVGDTSGYSIASITPVDTFSDVNEVRWSVNITDLGTRQWTEVKIIPAGVFDSQNLPCNNGLPCANSTPAELGSVSTSFFNSKPWVNVAGTLTKGRPWEEAHPADPARDSLRTRRVHFFRDNGDGTVTFGIEEEAGTFAEFTTPGSFPSGDVRVVFADHSYTPNKDAIPAGYTWHWDDLEIIVG